MSFSEPGRDDGSLPPVNVVIPDDARELDRDVLAYRRELRAKRRRQRFLRLFRPLRAPGFGGRTAIIPLIAACLAISLVGGALLSVATTSPASAPTLTGPQTSAQPAVSPQDLTGLPPGTLQVNGRAVPLRSLAPSAIAVIPANCGCGTALDRLATQAVAARTSLYFAGTGAAVAQLPALTARYGDGAAVAAADENGVLGSTYDPAGLTVLLVFKDATAEVDRNLSGNFQLSTVLRELKLAGTSPGKG
ncbi:MAG TPA: hypothetical protein VFO01_19415 [Trebonia sp.]|nr:hypothetical protein [Trebonia sp.]